jgi:ABC-2 type transport system permease protein
VIAVEIRKQAWRLRTYIALGLIAVIPIIFTVAYKVNPPMGGRLGFFDLNGSGLNVPIVALGGVSAFLLTVVASLFAGETVSGNRVLGSKLVVAAGLTLVAAFVVLVVGLAAGTLAFGWHPVTTPGLTVVSQGSALGSLALSTLYVAWCQAAYLAFAFMLSTMTDSAFGAVAGGVGLGVVSQILNNISALNGTSYVYPTHYLNAWQDLFFQGAPSTEILRGVLLQVPYVAVFLGIGCWWFSRKDILS